MRVLQFYMKRTLPFLLVFIFSACTGDNEKQEQSKVEQFTDRTAEEAANYIKTPLDKAHEAANKADQRNDAMKKAVEQAR